MFKKFSPSLFFSMSAVTVIVVAPFFMIFHPIFQNEFFQFNKSSATFIPNPINFRLVLVTGLVLIVMFWLLAYRRNMKVYLIGLLLFILSIGIGYLSTQNYLLISQEQLERHYLFEEQQYRWEEFDEVVYEYVVGSNKGDITFTTKTGDQFVIKEKELHSTGRSLIYQLSRENEVTYIEREKR
ncbi:acyl dehydratase [Solibacillus isronensis]|uniref:acyl dehydratase n=1 Tax=Solibacillus isronensis TaxID=412383 RepID=UPI00203B1D69|nr:acyl dehydratase [Solibacillus isronensis]